MYVVSRNMKVAKDISESVLEDLTLPSRVNKAEGFIRREVLVNKEADDFDIIKVLVYWKDKASQEKWHASKEHSQSHIDKHKLRKEMGKAPISRKELNMTFEEFELISTLSAE
ncbi:Heme oxygenase (staphylobilin-producing) [bioreactor metagenome]|uniref:Heme oxygenase (Staphylobilin-producing) n=1 Tax=bioreactor metagenome TaxID=1076179 RepID=A0A645E922_9ZZZZ|nr:antibiotic biosynthesis monooxygenase [Proteiniphilum sp.]MEA4917234.1 antibiotic biosynthesis monooxygenase [Proteiniphilum sp.]